MHAVIGIVDTMNHPELDMLSTVQRLVVGEHVGRRSWSHADVISPAKGAVIQHRVDGIAVVAAGLGASEDMVLTMIRATPDPVLLVVIHGKPSKALQAAVSARDGELVSHAPGALRKFHVSQKAHWPSLCQMIELVPPTASPSKRKSKRRAAKPSPADLPSPMPESKVTE